MVQIRTLTLFVLLGMAGGAGVASAKHVLSLEVRGAGSADAVVNFYILSGDSQQVLAEVLAADISQTPTTKGVIHHVTLAALPFTKDGTGRLAVRVDARKVAAAVRPHRLVEAHAAGQQTTWLHGFDIRGEAELFVVAGEVGDALDKE